MPRLLERLTSLYNTGRAQDGRAPLAVPRTAGKLRWRLISWWAGRRLEGRAREQFDQFLVYLPYLFTRKRFDAKATRDAISGRAPYPRIESYIDRIAEYAVTREWGRRVSWDPDLAPGSTDG